MAYQFTDIPDESTDRMILKAPVEISGIAIIQLVVMKKLGGIYAVTTANEQLILESVAYMGEDKIYCFANVDGV